MTVETLLSMLEDMRLDTEVVVHFGWDLTINDIWFDEEENKAVLFADDTDVAPVSRDWLDGILDR